MNGLKTPKMILFDYGNTLICEEGWNTLNGQTAVFKHVISNPDNVTPEDADNFAMEFYEKILSDSRNINIEIHQHQFMQLMYEYLGLEFDVPNDYIEKIFWDATSYGAIMPKIDKFISYMNNCGIRSGVISNIGFSGKLLEERINRLLPHNKFEFIIASSEYVFRKPHRILFDLAIKKANLSPEDIWFCGDHAICDIEGAHSAGMFPIKYYEKSKENLWAGPDKTDFSFPHLNITDWDELIQIIEKLR